MENKRTSCGFHDRTKTSSSLWVSILYPFLHCMLIQFLVIPFVFILLSHPFRSMKLFYGPLSSLWIGLYFLCCSLAGKEFLMPSRAATYGFRHMRFHHSLSSQFRSVGSPINLSVNMCLVSSTLD